MDGGTITIKTKLETKQFDAQIAKLEHELEQMEKSYATYKIVDPRDKEDMIQLADSIERTKNKLEDLRKAKLKAEEPRGFKELKNSVDGLGNGFQNAVKKASRLVLGIFGIRSAFMLMRRASSELASYDEGYAANLEYIRFVLTQAIAPVLEYVVNLAMKLLAYINAIAQAWFGVNLFERGSVDNFKKMKQGVGGVTGAVKELKKQLAGFDEINVLQDDGSVGTGGGGGGIALPSMDLANLQDIEIPAWVRWIMDHKGEILGLLTAVAAFFAGAKIASFIKGLTGAEGAVLGLNSQLGKMVAGAALVAGGIALMLTGTDNLIKNWDKMTNVEKAANIGLIAIGATLEAFGLMLMGVSGPVAAVIALTTALAILLIKWEEERINIDDVTAAQERLTKAREEAREAMKTYANAVENAEKTENELREAEERTGLSGQLLFDQVERGERDYRELNEAERTVYKDFLSNVEAQDELSTATENMTEKIRNQTDAIWLEKLATDTSSEGMQKWKEAVIDAADTGEIKVDDASRIFSKAMTGMSDEAQRTFAEDIPEEIQKGLSPLNYQTPLQRLQANFDTIFSNIATMARNTLGFLFNLPGTLARLAGNALGGTIGNAIWGQAKGAVVYNGLPKLAAGGIINQPRTWNTNRKSNSRRTWSRRCNSFNGFSTNAITRRSNRKIRNN